MDPNTEYILPFTNAKEFVEWARAAVARKQAIIERAQRDYDEYISRRKAALGEI